jgi:hypothetical protein
MIGNRQKMVGVLSLEVTMRKLAVLGGLVLILVACAAGEEPLPQPSASATTTSADTTTTSTEVDVAEIPQPDPASSLVVSAARVDLAQRLGVSEHDIEVTSLETGVWSDGSLGCPEPDMFYTQALIPGTRVALTDGKDMYWYHQGGSGEVFLCAEPVKDAFVGSGVDELIPPPGYND